MKKSFHKVAKTKNQLVRHNNEMLGYCKESRQERKIERRKCSIFNLLRLRKFASKQAPCLRW